MCSNCHLSLKAFISWHQHQCNSKTLRQKASFDKLSENPKWVGKSEAAVHTHTFCLSSDSLTKFNLSLESPRVIKLTVLTSIRHRPMIPPLPIQFTYLNFPSTERPSTSQFYSKGRKADTTPFSGKTGSTFLRKGSPWATGSY